MTEESGIDSRQGQVIFLFSASSISALGAIQFFYSNSTGGKAASA
jgi:hypothetical protein